VCVVADGEKNKLLLGWWIQASKSKIIYAYMMICIWILKCLILNLIFSWKSVHIKEVAKAYKISSPSSGYSARYSWRRLWHWNAGDWRFATAY
jgi:hypothetical protein